MNPATVLLARVKKAGGSVCLEDGKLMARKIPTELLPELKARKAEILNLLTRVEINDASLYEMTCRTCVHRTAMRSCGDPVRAELADTFTVRWHPSKGYNCPAWAPKPLPNDDDLIWIGDERFVVVTV